MDGPLYILVRDVLLAFAIGGLFGGGLAVAVA